MSDQNARVPAKKKRRVRSSHRGVVLERPDPSQRRYDWRGVYTDPDTSKTVKHRLDRLVYTTDEARTRWAKDKAAEIARRKEALKNGAPRATGSALSEAFKLYFDGATALRPRTHAIYRAAADKLEAWAEAQRLKSIDDLNRARLLAFRNHLASEPKRVAVPGGKRGERQAGDEPRSAVAVNQDLRALTTILRYLADADALARLTPDDLRRALKRQPVASDAVEFLSASHCKKLLEAALRHDAATMISREEEARLRREAAARGITRLAMAELRPTGTTPRHKQIAPFVLFMLLTGMRLGEALRVEWSSVDLDFTDNNGAPVGVIKLGSRSVKTKRGRVVGLDVSPVLRSLLAAMKLARGGKGSMFGLSTAGAESAAGRLRDTYGAPDFTWQMLRRTCATYLVNAPAIFGAASAHRSAAQLGHSVAVSEKHYLGAVQGISRDAHSLEAALGIEKLAAQIVARVGGAGGAAAGAEAGVVAVGARKKAARR